MMYHRIIDSGFRPGCYEEEGVMSDTGFLTQRSFNPASFGATLAINGGILGLLLTLAAGVAVAVDDDHTTIITTDAPTPPIVVPPDQPKVEKDKVDPVAVPPRATDTATKPKTKNLVIAAVAGDDLPPPAPLGSGDTRGDGGGIALPPAPIPLPHVPVITKPQIDARYKDAFQPDYPPGMIRAELEGSVIVRVLIGTDGRVKAVEAVRADQDAFLKATRDHALRKWRFKPATEDGAPIEAWREMTVRFQMPRT
jgi:periplasmic protein TonB